MSSAKITLRGMMQYCEDAHIDMFAGMLLPSGIEKDLVCNDIMMRGGEFEVLYPSPDTMVSLIAYWARRHYRTFDKWYKALNIDYEPLYNYDRTEEWEDNTISNSSVMSVGGASTKRTDSTTEDTTSREVNETDLLNEQEVDSTITNERSAYDSTGYQPHDKSTTDSESSSHDTGATTRNSSVMSVGSLTSGITESRTDSSNDHRADKGTHKGRMFGNIGVTTSQQMLEAELNIDTWNLYDHIADLFLQEFTVPVYM